MGTEVIDGDGGDRDEVTEVGTEVIEVGTEVAEVRGQR